jgi:phosphate transport system substrate-binding protein
LRRSRPSGAAFQTKTGAQVVYQSVGSGTGISDISQKLVDFGASDAPLTPSQAAACQPPSGCVTIPWALSATGVGIHINGLSTIRLTGPVLANIYLGNITNWDDPAIKKLNPHVSLPNLTITPVYRSDGSGDTYAFTDYLSRVSGAFKNGVGNAATSVSWPHGVGAKGNSGMVQVLTSTNGAIAYVAVGYLLQNWPKVASIKNQAGKFEVPNLKNIENAAKSVKHSSSAGYHIVNAPRKYKIAYPISTFTYVIAPRANAPQAGLLKEWINFVLNQGQAFGPRLDFAPMPSVVRKAALAAVGQIT